MKYEEKKNEKNLNNESILSSHKQKTAQQQPHRIFDEVKSRSSKLCGIFSISRIVGYM